MKTKSLLLLVSLFVVQGCGGSSNTVDGSSEEAMKASIQRIKESLDEEQKEEFDKAVMLLAFDGANLFQLGADKNAAEKQMREKLGGKTASQIIEEAKTIREDREAEQRKQMEAEFADLQAKLADQERAKDDLAKFIVKDSRFYFSESGFIKEPIIDITVENQMPMAVSRAYFKGVLATPGREVPWVEEDFNYSISGGVEPGEEQTWNLSPNMFGGWGKAPKDRNDMVLTVEVVRVDGANGEPIADATVTEREQDRYEQLKQLLGK